MHIYLVVNVENMELYYPSMLDYENDEQVSPTLEDLAHAELVEDIFL
jgi:hypothetical protein